jgi:hypothetical protein
MFVCLVCIKLRLIFTGSNIAYIRNGPKQTAMNERKKALDVLINGRTAELSTMKIVSCAKWRI